MQLPKDLIEISDALAKVGARAILVGGAVRDFLLNKELKDYDVEVYNLMTIEQLELVLSQFGSVNLVGKSFGILKLRVGDNEYDFSFPRRESKSGVGHRGFDVSIDGNLSYKEAARRRDFTINAMGYDILNQEILDPFGAKADLKNRVLRHIDDKSFVEDPLRVYRAVQFCARFDLELDSTTFKLCKKMVDSGELDELAKERVYEEFKKLLLKSNKPSIGFELMRELGLLRYFPELKAIIGVPQSPIWHPEGDVWVHTMMSLDKMAFLLQNSKLQEREKLKFMFAILCHDFGKPKFTKIDKNGNITSVGHELGGVEPTVNFLQKLTNDVKLIESIIPLVEHHLKPSIYYANGAKDSTIKRLATKVNIKDLVLVAKADNLGRSTEEALSGEYKAGEWLLKRAKELQVDSAPIEPLLKGRDLIELGLSPSPKFKEILDTLYQAQLDGNIANKEDAIAFVKMRFKS